MIKQLATYVSFLILFSTVSWAAETSKAPSDFPLLGMWEATSIGLDLAHSAAPPRTELNFTNDQKLTFVMIDPSGKTKTPIRLSFEYTYQYPDVVTFRYDANDKFIERYKFKINGNTFSWHQIDAGTVGTFRRIEKTGFFDPPMDLKEIPQPQ